MKIQTDVLVIGGGLTGAGVLRDLALRGIDAVLVERKDLESGASGANHGLLHSGARYVVKDAASAAECVAENEILKKMAPSSIEDCGGVFVALNEDDDQYIDDFKKASEAVGLPFEEMDVAELLKQEPMVNKKIKAAIRVKDGAINPFMAGKYTLAHAVDLGARVLYNTEVTSMNVSSGTIESVEAVMHNSGETVDIEAQQIINASGPWAGKISAMAGAEIPMAYSKGSLLVYNSRISNMVINRLRPPGDGDIIVPGETVSILGTTSIRVNDPDNLTVDARTVDYLIDEGAALVPSMKAGRFIREYRGVRPLVTLGGDGDDRTLSRSFALIDHSKDNVNNLVTITSGKLTTYRLMAEKAVDIVAPRVGNSEGCKTAEIPLPGDEKQVHLNAAHRLERIKKTGSPAICECEMVTTEEVDDVINDLEENNHGLTVNAIRLRTRLGMGACQGAYCGFRAIGHLYNKELIEGNAGSGMVKNFMEKRWSGLKPVLWGSQLRQEQLIEAIYCGTFNIDGDL
jgi:glycerol-3-phosphate dehydrogenase